MNSTYTGFAKIVIDGLNNPDCAFYTGQMFGQLTSFKLWVLLAAFYLLMRVIDKLAFEPGLLWLKYKIYKGKKNEVK